MLKITATGNLTNDVELKLDEVTGKPYAILRIASDRRYRIRDGRRLTDFISIKVRGRLAQRCAAYAVKGCRLTAHGDFETIVFDEAPTASPVFSSRPVRWSSSGPVRWRRPPMRSLLTKPLSSTQPDAQHRYRVRQRGALPRRPA